MYTLFSPTCNSSVSIVAALTFELLNIVTRNSTLICNETSSGATKNKDCKLIYKPIFIKLVSMESYERGIIANTWIIGHKIHNT